MTCWHAWHLIKKIGGRRLYRCYLCKEIGYGVP